MPSPLWISPRFISRRHEDKKVDNVDNVALSLQSISLNDKDKAAQGHDIPPPLPPKPRQSLPFVGGFHPSYADSPSGTRPAFPIPITTPGGGWGAGRRITSSPGLIAPPPGPLPRPPAMPFQPGMSLTMQHALAVDDDMTYLSVPAQAHAPGPATPDEAPQRSVSASVIQVHTQLAKPPARRAASVPPSPSSAGGTSSGGTVQCSGTTKTNKRCTRQVKIGPPLLIYRPELGPELERFCHQHRPDMLKEVGFNTQKGRFVKFEDYIPGYLHPTTQAALRIEMAKSPSQSDEEGFIYTFEIIDPQNPDLLLLKVGRTNKLKKRLDEWDKQCASKAQVLRGWWPDGLRRDGADLLKGRVQAGQPGRCSHRLERLVHLELADLAMSKVYMGSSWPNDVATAAAADDLTSVSSSPGTPSKRPKKQEDRCTDCGKEHKEIFTFARVQQGKLRGKEWEKVVLVVIEKWGKYVDDHL